MKGSLDAFASVLASSKPEHNPQYGDRLMKSLRGEPLEPVTLAKMTRDEQFAATMFRRFTEIHNCIERLKDCEAYVGSFPFKRGRITRHAYLQLVVEAHLNELYVLRERLLAYAKTVERAYRKDLHSKEIAKVTASLEAFVVKVLSSFARARGSHIHEYRYSHDDIERLQLVALLKLSPDKEFKKRIRALGKVAIADTHARLRNQAKKWNLLASRVIEMFAKEISPLVISNDLKSFRYPNARPVRSNLPLNPDAREQTARAG